MQIPVPLDWSLRNDSIVYMFHNWRHGEFFCTRHDVHSWRTYICFLWEGKKAVHTSEVLLTHLLFTMCTSCAIILDWACWSDLNMVREMRKFWLVTVLMTCDYCVNSSSLPRWSVWRLTGLTLKSSYQLSNFCVSHISSLSGYPTLLANWNSVSQRIDYTF